MLSRVKYVTECGVDWKNAWCLTSTGLRKHVATVSQLINLSNNELDCLAKYLGHNITVHRQYYRLTEESVELGKISKLLQLMAEGRLSDLKNKTLDSITMEEEKEDEEDFDQLNKKEHEEEDPNKINQNNENKNKTTKMSHDRYSDWNCESSSSDDYEDYLPKKSRTKQNVEQGTPSTSRLKKIVVKKRPWSDIETSTIQQHFMKFIVEGKKGPNKKECEQFLDKHGHVLNHRSYRDIVYHVSNLKRKRMK